MVPVVLTSNSSTPLPPARLSKPVNSITSLFESVNSQELVPLTSQSLDVPPVKVLPVPAILRLSILLKSLTAILWPVVEVKIIESSPPLPSILLVNKANSLKVILSILLPVRYYTVSSNDWRVISWESFYCKRSYNLLP